jgi:HEAT repeat protein
MRRDDGPGWTSAWLGVPWLALAPCLIAVAPARAQTLAEPVERLRQSLAAPYADARARDEAVRQCLGDLRGLTDLRQALALSEWKENHPDPEWAETDQANRRLLAEQFCVTARTVLRPDDPAVCAVALDLVGEVAREARARGDRPGPVRGLGPVLAALMQTGPAALRARAVRALGLIDPDLATAIPAFQSLLQSPDPTLREASLEGLHALLKEAVRSLLPSAAAAGMPRMDNREVIEVAAAVAGEAGRGLSDRSPGVRRKAVAVFATAATTLTNLVCDPPGAEEFGQVSGSPGRPGPLLATLARQAPGLVTVLREGDVESRLEALKLLEELAYARSCCRRQAAGSEPGHADLLLAGLRPALPDLAGATADPDVRVRRSALDVLGLLGPAATGAADALSRALKDPDCFVRRSAVRALRAVGPVALREASPGLTQLLNDPDRDVRTASAAALRSADDSPVVQAAWVAQPAAPAAGPLSALARGLSHEDAEVRLATLRAAPGMSLEAAALLPLLCRALADADPRVRKLAADLLGRLGPEARAAEISLRHALNDPDAAVRRASAAALLNLVPPPAPTAPLHSGRREPPPPPPAPFPLSGSEPAAPARPSPPAPGS